MSKLKPKQYHTQLYNRIMEELLRKAHPSTYYMCPTTKKLNRKITGRYHNLTNKFRDHLRDGRLPISELPPNWYYNSNTQTFHKFRERVVA